jgi:hypothetical protein
MEAMSPQAEVIKPDFAASDFHQAKYEVFKLMYQHQLEYNRIMNSRFQERSVSTGAD